MNEKGIVSVLKSKEGRRKKKQSNDPESDGCHSKSVKWKAAGLGSLTEVD